MDGEVGVDLGVGEVDMPGRGLLVKEAVTIRVMSQTRSPDAVERVSLAQPAGVAVPRPCAATTDTKVRRLCARRIRFRLL
jgi:hypothetical protein